MATYKIVSGDTLSGIAKKLGTTTSELQGLNPTITDINKIYAGQTLNLPTSSPFKTPIIPTVLTPSVQTPVIPSSSVWKPAAYNPAGGYPQPSSQQSTVTNPGQPAVPPTPVTPPVVPPVVPPTPPASPVSPTPIVPIPDTTDYSLPGTPTDDNQAILDALAALKSPTALELYEQFRTSLGIGGKEDALTATNEQITKTTNLLDTLESDINQRIEGLSTTQPILEAQRRRTLTTEQKPLQEQLASLGRTAGVEQAGLTTAQNNLTQMMSLAENQTPQQKLAAQIAQEQLYKKLGLGSYYTKPETTTATPPATPATPAPTATSDTTDASSIAKLKENYGIIRQKAADGGWDFFDKNGNPISIQDISSQLKTPLDVLLKGSGNPMDELKATGLTDEDIYNIEQSINEYGLEQTVSVGNGLTPQQIAIVKRLFQK